MKDELRAAYDEARVKTDWLTIRNVCLSRETQTLTVSVYTEVIRDCFGNAAAYSTVLTVTSVLSMLLFFKITGKRSMSV